LPAARPALAGNIGLALVLVSIVGVWLRFLLPADPAQRMGLMLFAVITLVLAGVALTRPPARCRDGRWWVYLVCVLSIVYPLGYFYDGNNPLLSVIFWGRVTLQLVANLSLLSLGRSYAMLPALRQVQTGLFYGLVRHPVYAMYILADLVALSLQPSLWNCGVALVGLTVFSTRARLEENVLCNDPAYLDYMSQVRWRFCPGIY
jgi:protein-S-isoprenylcysteine O-methyltransferase Ste14